MQFDDERFYDEFDLIADERFTPAVLARARASGQLKFKQIRRGWRLYKGRWLNDWLQTPDKPEEREP